MQRERFEAALYLARTSYRGNTKLAEAKEEACLLIKDNPRLSNIVSSLTPAEALDGWLMHLKSLSDEGKSDTGSGRK